MVDRLVSIEARLNSVDPSMFHVGTNGSYGSFLDNPRAEIRRDADSSRRSMLGMRGTKDNAESQFAATYLLAPFAKDATDGVSVSRPSEDLNRPSLPKEVGLYRGCFIATVLFQKNEPKPEDIMAQIKVP